MKGSYTVEAAVVMSLVFFVLGALILASFYIHDRAVLQGFICEITAAGSNFATEKERQEAVTNVKKQITAKRFMGSRSLSGNASAGKKEVSASWSAVFPIPGFAMKYLNGNQLKIEKKWTGKVVDPAEIIRKVRGADKFITGGNGG